MILLIGIVKKNAIMMIDFALQAEREERLTSREAIFRAAMMRFRPIMMTTSAALLGALPLCFSLGEGSELRQPLGVSIVGGLIVSQALTLYTTPIVYHYLDRLGLRLRRGRGAGRRRTQPPSAREGKGEGGRVAAGASRPVRGGFIEGSPDGRRSRGSLFKTLRVVEWRLAGVRWIQQTDRSATVVVGGLLVAFEIVTAR